MPYHFRRLERERTVGNDEVMAMNSAAGIKIKVILRITSLWWPSLM